MAADVSPTSGASVPRRLSAHRETRVRSSRNPDWPSPGHARGPRPCGALATALVWSVSESDDRNRIVPPVQFGIASLGARSTPNPPASLQAGLTYRLTLYARATSGGDGILAFTILTR